jgi:YVTN family beta-propeller protein
MLVRACRKSWRLIASGTKRVFSKHEYSFTAPIGIENVLYVYCRAPEVRAYILRTHSYDRFRLVEGGQLMTTRVQLIGLVVFQVLSIDALAHGAQMGTLEQTYPNLGVNKFVLHPTQPYIYATVPSHNSVAIINTNTLTLENMVFIGSGPNGLAISPDGHRVYVANASSNFIGVLDTNSRTTLPSIQVREAPLDVEVGVDGRLYVLGNDTLMQINPATGATAGPNIGTSFMVYSGELEISPNKDRLYYADYGLSPASLYQFDVTANPPVKLWESPHGGTSGSNGQDLNISHDGSFISYPCGAGQIGYSIAKYRTSDMAILGTFNTGAYPREIAFSPDDTVAYTVHTAGLIDVWDTTTYRSLGTIRTTGTNVSDISELLVDRTGRHLFAAYSDSYYGNYELRVYDTGRVVPEPLSVGLALIGLLSIACRGLGSPRQCLPPSASVGKSVAGFRTDVGIE